MPEYIGPIEIPSVSASGTFPVTLPWGVVRVLDPLVHVHQFGSGDLKIEQRFYQGPGQRRITVSLGGLTLAERLDINEFFDLRKGSYQPFTLPVADADGTITNYTVRFAANTQSNSQTTEDSWATSLEFVEEPTADPSYTTTGTLTRFPDSSLASSLLGQTHEIVPLLEIVAGGVVRQNLLRYSEEMDNATAWSSFNMTVTANTATAPDGTTTADTVTSAGGPYARTFNSGNAVTAGTQYTFSFYVKKISGSFFGYRIYDFTNSADIVADTNYDSQTVTGEWRRVSVTFTPSTNSSNVGFYVLATSAAASGYFWGAQLNEGATAATYQKTTTAAIDDEEGESTIYLSDRRVTVDSNLYQPRILGVDGITQTLGSASDLASFRLGNADRVLSDLANTIDLDRADVRFALLHVGTLTRINLWRGHVSGWSFDAGPEFRLEAADGASELRLAYPRRKISRQAGFDVPNQPVNVGGKKGISRITATSVTNDTAYGRPLKDVWVNNSTVPLPVECELIAGRDESEFYTALGIVGRGPISLFGTLHTLDNQYQHGPGSLGLRRSYGGNANTGDPTAINNAPDAGSDSFSLDSIGEALPVKPLDGVAFLQLRRTDEKGIQAVRPNDHQMVAHIAGGLGGWIWSGPAPYDRNHTISLTNPIWIAVNTYLEALGLAQASKADQEAVFDVASAIAAAAICSTSVTKLIGTGTESQFTFTGIIGREERPLADWLNDILASCLGYWSNTYGKLRFGVRINSSTVEAFTAGNVIHGSLAIMGKQAAFNDLTVSFADVDYRYQANTVSLVDTDHQTRTGQTLKANANLLGVTTKSQAARICTVALREAMGGVSAAEQRAARRISFRTTILALNTEPGMVCSLTHPDMPGGSGEFRVQGWRLNPDWTIDIEGETTTDSMYDLTAGPKPDDIEPEELPELTAPEPVLGAVAPDHVTDLTAGGSSQKTVRGQVWNQIEGSYTAPDADGFRDFDGVEVYLYDETGAEFPQGHFVYDGGPEGEGEFAFDHIAGEGSSNVTWTVKAVARSRFAAADIATAPDVEMEVGQKDAAAKEPTGVTLTVSDRGGSQYGLSTAWTPPDPAGATVGYNHEARFYSDSGGTTPVSEWIPLGDVFGVATAAAEAGPFARPADVTYAQTRVRGFNPFGGVSNWGNSNVAAVQPGTGGTGNPLSGVTVSVVNGPANTYALATSWTKPTIAAGVSGYSREARFFIDSGGTTPESKWIPLGDVYGYATEEADTDFWPRPLETRYVKIRVAPFDANGGRGAWVESSLATVNPQAAPSVVTAVTVTGIAYGEGHYGLRAEWTEPTDTSGVLQYEREARFYTDSGLTTPDSEWIPLGITFPPDETEDAGPFERQYYTTYAVVRVRSVAHNGATSAWAESSNYAEIAPLAIPPQPESVAVTVGTDEGPLSFRFEIEVTANATPGTTDGYQAEAQYYTDSGGTTAESDWIPLGWIDPANLTISTDYWSRPEATRYAKIRVAGQNLNNQIGAWRESSVVTIPALDLGAGVNIVDGALTATKDGGGLSNGNFEAGLNDWTPTGAGIVATETDAYAGQAAYIPGDGNDKYLEQIVPVIPGRVLRLECYARESTNSTGSMYIQWRTPGGTYISNSTGVTITGDTYTRYTETATAPATAGQAVIGFALLAAATSGRMLIDNVVLTVEEPVTGGVKRDASGLAVDVGNGMQIASGKLTPLLADRLIIVNEGGQMKLSAAALTNLATWGLSAADFDESGGNLIVKNAVIARLLTQTITLTGEMRVQNSTTDAYVLVNASGTEIAKGSNKVVTTSTGISIQGGGAELNATSSQITFGSGWGVTIDSSKVTCKGFEATADVTFSSAFGPSITAKSAWRTELGLGTMATKNTGATGSFTTTDGKTVTVTDGIITSIV